MQLSPFQVTLKSGGCLPSRSGSPICLANWDSAALWRLVILVLRRRGDWLQERNFAEGGISPSATPALTECADPARLNFDGTRIGLLADLGQEAVPSNAEPILQSGGPPYAMSCSPLSGSSQLRV